MDIKKEIDILKKKKKAVILAHYYTLPEVQESADCLGDSLALAQYAQKADADIIVFAGVHFMAETAKILNPDKMVCIPDFGSRCSLAETCPAEDFRVFREEHPDHRVISYINCSAAVKAMSDVICTSGNAERIVASFGKDEKLIFAPDENLGNYINRKTGRNMLLWNGGCHVHFQLDEEDYMEAVSKHPDAVFIAHPECRERLLEHAAFVGSTTALINYVGNTEYPYYIIATEEGIGHEIHRRYPFKKVEILRKKNNIMHRCAYMKLNTLEKIYDCLKYGRNEIEMDADLIEKARIPILKMLSLS